MSVRTERRGPVTVVTIDRPEASNALDAAVLTGLSTAFAAAEADDDVAVVVLTGAGDRAFCAGLDLRAFSEGADPVGTAGRGGLSVFRHRIAKPLVAAVNGHAVAGGFELLLRCDLVVAAEHAELGLPEVQRGLVGAYGMWVLPRRVPVQTALEIGLTGDRITAARAFELGIVNRVVAKGTELDAAVTLALRIAAHGPLAVRLTKQVAYASEDARARDTWAIIHEVTEQATTSDDAREGAAAFVEKRAPRWTGH